MSKKEILNNEIYVNIQIPILFGIVKVIDKNHFDTIIFLSIAIYVLTYKSSY